MGKKTLYKPLTGLAGKATRFSSRRLNFTLAIVSAFFVVLASLVYIWAQGKAEKALVEQTLHREQVIARAGARSIESFLKLTENTLAVFATRTAIVDWGDETQDALDKLLSEWSGAPLVEVSLVDNQGNVRYVASQKKPLPESRILVSERDYFQALKDTASGKVFMGNPVHAKFGQYQGEYIIPVTATINKGEEFKGIVGIAILVSQLTKEYLEPLKISPETQIFLIDKNGLFLYSPYPGTIGKNIVESIQQQSFPGREKLVEVVRGQLAISGERKLDLIWPDLRNLTYLRRYLLASSPVRVGERGWILGVATPIEDVELFYSPFALTFTMTLIIAILIIISFSALLVLVARVTQKDAYLEGFADGRDHREK